eukprot:NODE_8364_length_361_cov_31.833333_g6618_i0.p3 GENE.NODE_8364_length_361_cov_31.833333_g6618_i0~~NODE_8364_length_361_cov_31.833333_g6618_i0.p3  ORF type:complete len:76 (-),score=22.77 NODE_8364_length_361_cov_31.833333_g6618_i0:134-331(-)
MQQQQPKQGGTRAGGPMRAASGRGLGRGGTPNGCGVRWCTRGLYKPPLPLAPPWNFVKQEMILAQ